MSENTETELFDSSWNRDNRSQRRQPILTVMNGPQLGRIILLAKDKLVNVDELTDLPAKRRFDEELARSVAVAETIRADAALYRAKQAGRNCVRT